MTANLVTVSTIGDGDIVPPSGETRILAAVIIDTEAEYTQTGKPTIDPNMQKLLQRHGRSPSGVSGVHVYHLVGR